MSIARNLPLLLLLFAMGFGALLASAVNVDRKPPQEIVRAYGVISQCGVYAVIVVRRDGSSTMYRDDSPAPAEVEQEITELPQEQREAVVVPCPSSKQTIPA